MWLKAPIEECDEDGTRRMSGGKGNTRGTPQGGVASPLLANIYMNRFLKYCVSPAAARHSALGSSPTLTTSSSSVAVTQLRHWRGRKPRMTKSGSQSTR